MSHDLPSAPEQDVAPPEVAVHEGRAAGREELSEPGSHGPDHVLELAAGGELQEAGAVEGVSVARGRGVDGAGADPRRAAAPVRGGGLVQPRQAAPERLVVAGGPRHLVDRSGDEKVGVDEHDLGDRWGSGRRAELAQPVGFVQRTCAHLGDEAAPAHLDHPGRATEWSGRLDRADGDREASAQVRQELRLSHALTLPP